MTNYKIVNDNCLYAMRKMEENSVDAVVCDPPYGLSFMGKKWDYDVPSVEIWKECLRVLKPGGHLLAFAGTRTQHRIAVNIEDAGFEIRDMIMYVYGSGFPKSHNIEKALNKIGGCGIMVVEEVDKDERTTQKSKHDLRYMSKANIQKTESNKKAKREILQQSLPKQSISFKNQQLSNNVWEGQPSLERWNYLQTSEGQLQRCEICEMSEKVYINGEERWVCNGTQVSNGKTFTKMFDKEGSCSSYRPQSSEQQDRKFNAVPKQYRTQDIRRANEEYKGFGSALKPACEPITVARKPFKGTVANNVLQYGTGGINIDECRVEFDMNDKNPATNPLYRFQNDYKQVTDNGQKEGVNVKFTNSLNPPSEKGRFPANFLHDGSEEVVSLFPNNKSTSGKKTLSTSNIYGGNALNGSKTTGTDEISGYTDSGSAARYFYCAKCSKKDRNEGMGDKVNSHCTVKPTDLMQYLVRLVTPKGGTVLDPFMGSGSTGKACMYEGFNFVGMELDEDYCKIAEARIEFAKDQKKEEQMNIFEVI